jgi:hypothetical protein
MLIANPKGYLTKELGKEGTALKTCYVSQRLIDEVESAVEEAINSDTWLHAPALLPPSFSEQDVSTVLSLSSSASDGKKCTLMGDGAFVVSKGFLKKCSEHVSSRAAGMADHYAGAEPLPLSLHEVFPDSIRLFCAGGFLREYFGTVFWLPDIGCVCLFAEHAAPLCRC